MMIRLATPADAAAVAAIYAPYVTETAACFELEAPDATEMGRRMRDVGELYPWLVAELEGDVVGYAYGTRHRARPAYQWSTEVSVYVRRSGHRRGVGRGLYLPLLELLRLQGYINAYAAITLPNPGSVAFHEALGFSAFTVFRAVGFKHGAWHDVGWYLRLLSPHPADPGDPRPMAALTAAGEVERVLQEASERWGQRISRPDPSSGG